MDVRTDMEPPRVAMLACGCAHSTDERVLTITRQLVAIDSPRRTRRATICASDDCASRWLVREGIASGECDSCSALICDSWPIPSVNIDGTIPVVLSGLYGDGETNVCESCADEYFTCDYCESFTPVDSGYGASCDDCGTVYCSDSCQQNHTEDSHDYYDSDGGSSEDYGTSAMSIRDALALPAIAGEIVRSVRAVGVEIETANGYSGVDSDATQYLYDVHSEHCGTEYVTLPMRGANLEQGLDALLSSLRDSGWSPNEDCGSHFHLDMSALNSRERILACAALRIIEPLLFALTDDNRHVRQWTEKSENRWSASVTELLTDDVLAHGSLDWTSYDRNLVGHSRYCAINAHALTSHETVEIRIMGGTDYDRRDASGVSDVTRLLHAIAIASAVVDYVIERDAMPDGAAGELRKYVTQPFALLYQVARATGLVSGKTIEYAESRWYVSAWRNYVGKGAA